MKYHLKIKLLVVLLLTTTLACKTDSNNKTEKVTTARFENTIIQHTVLSNGHPMAVWEKKANNAKGAILLIHGRTYSSLPNFDLQVEGEDLSFMDGITEQGYNTYALDLRGHGGTPRDSTQWLSPDKAAKDILNVLNWISKENNNINVHLFGFSMGTVSTLLATQKNDKDIASLTLFGFGKDLDKIIPKQKNDVQLKKIVNTPEHAASDFITPGNISQKAIDAYVEMGLKYDPVKTDWRNYHELNSIDPSIITTPVLLLQGELDPYSPTEKQVKLFTRLKTADKSWVVISGGDHAAFLETPRKHFIHSLTSFIDRFNE